MKIGKNKTGNKAVNPSTNNSMRNLLLIVVIFVTVMLIAWVFMIGKKAEKTVSVCMWSQEIYKNQQITEDMLVEYPMVEAEFNKYALDNKDVVKTNRIFLWESRNLLLGTFAAYPLHKDTIAFTSDVITSRIDNSDSVLYAFPGKDILPLEIDSQELKAFKTFLQPGDRLNITALFSIESDVIDEDTGKQTKIETIKEEQFLTDVMIADLLNSDGNSVLDIYESYRNRTVQQQAQLDATEAFQKSVEPETLLLAFTPEEKSRYYQFLAKKDVQFKISLPQRTE